MAKDKVAYKNYNTNNEAHVSRYPHNVGEIIRALMSERKIDDSTLVKATGIASSSLSRIKNDSNTNPTLASLQPIANYFGITVSQLIGETALNKGYVTEPVRHMSVIVKQVPIIDWEAIYTHHLGELQEFSQWLPINRALSEKAFVVIVENSSWGPLFPKGTYLFVEPEISIIDGDYALVFSNKTEKYFAKKILIDGDETYLQSLNPDIKVTERLKAEESLYAPIIELRHQFK